jgi:hypothetical protein
MQKINRSIISVLMLLGSSPSFGASSTGESRQKVIRSISISNISGLDFGIASAGDRAKTIPPDNRETPENASFMVTGERHTMYFIHLPPDQSIEMSTAGGGARDKKIPVDLFKSNPVRFGVLDHGGKQTLFVGATRAELLSNQQAGDYVGYFTVTVVY